MGRTIVFLLFFALGFSSCINSSITVSLKKVLSNTSGGSFPGANNDSTEDNNYNYILSAPGLIQTTSSNGKSYFFDSNAQAIFELNTTTGSHSPIYTRSELIPSEGRKINHLYLCSNQNFGILEVENNETNATELLKFDLETKQTSLITSTDNNIAELQMIINARLDISCDNLYVLDGGSQSLIKIEISTGLASIISSNSVGSGGNLFNSPKDIYLDELNNEIFVSDYGYFSPFYQGYLFKIDTPTGNKSLVSNYDIGTGTSFIFRDILNIEASENNHLYAYAERYIFEVDKATGDRVTIFDDGDIPDFNIFEYRGFTLDPTDSSFALLNGGSNSPLIYKMNLSTPSGAILTSGYTSSGPNIIKTSSMAIISNESKIFFSSGFEEGIIEVDSETGIRSITSNNSHGSGPAYSNEGNPQIAVTSDDNFLYYFGQNSQYVLKVEIATGNRTIIIDTTTSPTFPFSDLSIMKLGPTNQYLYFAGRYSEEIYRLDVTNGNILKLADNSGTGSGVALCAPKNFTLNQDETKLYVFNCSSSGIVELDLMTLQRITKTDSSLLNFDLDFNNPFIFPTDKEDHSIIAIYGYVGDLNLTTGEEIPITSPFSKGKGNIIPSTINSMQINKDRTYIYIESDGELFKINTKSGNRKIISKWFGKVLAS